MLDASSSTTRSIAEGGYSGDACAGDVPACSRCTCERSALSDVPISVGRSDVPISVGRSVGRTRRSRSVGRTFRSRSVGRPLRTLRT